VFGNGGTGLGAQVNNSNLGGLDFMGTNNTGF